MYQTFEVTLSAPGKDLIDICSQKSEGMMKGSMHRLTASENGIISQGKEKGTLSIITEQRFIRRVYLNNKVIPMEVDLCSLVSIVTCNRLESSRILEVVKRTEVRALGRAA